MSGFPTKIRAFSKTFILTAAEKDQKPKYGRFPVFY